MANAGKRLDPITGKVGGTNGSQFFISVAPDRVAQRQAHDLRQGRRRREPCRGRRDRDHATSARATARSRTSSSTRSPSRTETAISETPPQPGAPVAPPVCPRHPDRVSYVRCQRCGRPTCPECQRQAAVGVHCVDCVAEAARAMPSHAHRARRACGTTAARSSRSRSSGCASSASSSSWSMPGWTTRWLFSPVVGVLRAVALPHRRVPALPRAVPAHRVQHGRPVVRRADPREHARPRAVRHALPDVAPSAAPSARSCWPPPTDGWAHQQRRCVGRGVRPVRRDPRGQQAARAVTSAASSCSSASTWRSGSSCRTSPGRRTSAGWSPVALLGGRLRLRPRGAPAAGRRRGAVALGALLLVGTLLAYASVGAFG